VADSGIDGFDNFAERLGRSDTEPLHVKLRYCHLSPPKAAVMMTVLVGELVIRDLLSSFVVASFFMLTSRSDGTMAQTGLPSTSAIRVFRTRRGSMPMASIAC
jgi:hypothetical protein